MAIISRNSTKELIEKYKIAKKDLEYRQISLSETKERIEKLLQLDTSRHSNEIKMLQLQEKICQKMLNKEEKTLQRVIDHWISGV